MESGRKRLTPGKRRDGGTQVSAPPVVVRPRVLYGGSERALAEPIRVRIQFLKQVDDFLDGCSAEVAAKVSSRLDQLRETYPAGHWRFDGKVWERATAAGFDGALRLHVSKQRLRFLFGVDKRTSGVHRFVFLNAFAKDSWKWPRQEIVNAEARWAAFKSEPI